MKNFLVPAIAALVLVACSQAPERSAPGTTYRRIARPEIWQLLASSQAETLGFLPGDLLLSYNREPVEFNADVIAAQERAAGASGLVPVTVLREGAELTIEVRPGPLGALPVVAKYPSSLAIALEDILRSQGLFADYDWLAALTGESFSLAAAEGECLAWWPGGVAGAYLYDVALMVGVRLQGIYSLAEGGNARDAIRGALLQGRSVLVRGGWPDYRDSFWGVATRYDAEKDAVFGYTLDGADEVPLAGVVVEVYTVEAGRGWDEPDELLALALTEALELGQGRRESGWKTGLQAYDLLIAGLDSVPFCPVCGPDESPACFNRLLWAMVANKTSAIRFLESMREAAPDQAALIDEIAGDIQAQLGKLEGIMRSRASIGNIEDQRKIARVVADVQVIENDLLGLYEELLTGL